MTVAPAISVTLDQISGAGSGTCSDHRAFTTTNHRTADGSDAGADQRAFESTVMRPITPVAPLRIDVQTSETTEQKNHRKHYC